MRLFIGKGSKGYSKFTIDKKSEDDKSKLEELPQITESAEVKSTSESVMEKYAKKEPLPLQEFIDSLADNAGVDTKCNVYKSKFLDCKRVPNRSHVYIDRECATLIKNVLPIIAPDASISGFVSNIVADHLEKYKPEIIKMYNDRISKIM